MESPHDQDILSRALLESDPNLVLHSQSLALSNEDAHRIQEGQNVYEDVAKGTGEVFQRLRQMLQSKDAVIVALGGPSRSGKGFFTENLRSMAESEHIGLCTIPMDWFYLLKEERLALENLLGEEVTFDDPGSIWYERLHLTLQALQSGATQILFPDYHYENQGKERIWQKNISLPSQQKKIYVVDGIFAGHPVSGVPALADIHVHMNADGATQIARRIQVDRERGSKTVDAAHIFLDFVAQKRNKHIDPFAKSADIVIQNTMPPDEIMRRAPRRDQIKMLLRKADRQQYQKFIAQLQEQDFVESNHVEFADMYTGIPGRLTHDYARLRFSQGDKGIHKAELTLSLHSQDGVNYKSDYHLYPQASFARKYQQGLMASLNVSSAIAVWKERIEMVCGKAIIFIDRNISAEQLQEAFSIVDNNRIQSSVKASTLPDQIEIINASTEQQKKVNDALQQSFEEYERNDENTFQLAKELLQREVS